MKSIYRKYDYDLKTGHLKERLRDKAIRGGVSVMTAQGVSFALRTASILILARVLLPEDFGLIAMVTAITAIAEQFKDLGLSTATVQLNNITHEQVNALFWINVGFGVCMMSIIAALAWAIAWFYNDQRLVGITLAISSSFIFGGSAVQHDALLRRQMRFGAIAWIRIVSESISIALAVGLAVQGFGYWSLVWKEVARSLCIAIGTWLKCQWRPGTPKITTGLGEILRFGRDITGFHLVTFFARNVDQILLGKFWGAAPLGLYRQGYSLISTPLSQIHYPVDSVAQPTLSALQNDPEKYSKYVLKIVSILSFIVMPMVTYLAIFSDNVVHLLLGERWMGAAPIIRIFAVAGLLSAPTSVCNVVMITTGKTLRNFRYALMRSILLILAFSIGTAWGPIGVATAFTIAMYVWAVPSLWYSFRDTPVTVREVLKSVSSPAFCSFAMGLILLLLSPELSRLGDFGVPLSLLLGVSVYFGAWLLLPGGMMKLKEYFSYPLLALKFRA